MVLKKKKGKKAIKVKSKFSNKKKNSLTKTTSSNSSDSLNPKVTGYASVIYFLALILLDRLTKFAVMNLKDIKDFGWVIIRFVYNTGAGFSILENNNTLLIWIAIIALCLIVYFRTDFPKISLILILSGLLGNLIDRMTFGAVIDFIDLRFFPIFNMADIYISLGVAITLIYQINKEYFRKNTSRKKNKIQS